jgi:hypothetical protein
MKADSTTKLLARFPRYSAHVDRRQRFVSEANDAARCAVTRVDEHSTLCLRCAPDAPTVSIVGSAFLLSLQDPNLSAHRRSVHRIPITIVKHDAMTNSLMLDPQHQIGAWISPRP